MSSIWDTDEFADTAGEFVKFEVVGDTVTGTITAIGKKTWDDGSVSPQLDLDTADGPKTLTAGQTRLKAALREQRPEVGDRIKVTLTQIEKRTGGKTLKHFDLAVAKGAAAPVAAAPALDEAPPW